MKINIWESTQNDVICILYIYIQDKRIMIRDTTVDCHVISFIKEHCDSTFFVRLPINKRATDGNNYTVAELHFTIKLQIFHSKACWYFPLYLHSLKTN